MLHSSFLILPLHTEADLTRLIRTPGCLLLVAHFHSYHVSLLGCSSFCHADVDAINLRPLQPCLTWPTISPCLKEIFQNTDGFQFFLVPKVEATPVTAGSQDSVNVSTCFKSLGLYQTFQKCCLGPTFCEEEIVPSHSSLVIAKT